MNTVIDWYAKPEPWRSIGLRFCRDLGVECETPAHVTTHPYWDQVVGQKGATYAEFDEASGKENLFEAGGQPDYSEIAEGVVWLASDRSHMVTGHALPMDAGWIAKRGG